MSSVIMDLIRNSLELLLIGLICLTVESELLRLEVKVMNEPKSLSILLNVTEFYRIRI